MSNGGEEEEKPYSNLKFQPPRKYHLGQNHSQYRTSHFSGTIYDQFIALCAEMIWNTKFLAHGRGQ